MFERFTDQAQRAVAGSQDEARARHHTYIGPEHLLLALLREPEGVAHEALQAMSVDSGILLTRLEEGIGYGPGRGPSSTRIPFTPAAKKCLETALSEALQLGHKYIGAEHILLGTLRERDRVAAQTLMAFGVEPSALRAQVARLVGRSGPAGPGNRPAGQAGPVSAD